MKFNKKIVVVAGLVSFVLIGIAASKRPNEFKNLKVLPKNISEQTLDTVMHEFTKALKVDCDFCHVKPADSTEEWDMASDEKPEKNGTHKSETKNERPDENDTHKKVKHEPDNQRAFR